MTAGPPPRRQAEIAGAGIAGLAAAAALAGRGWAVRVHERDAELRELGAGISLRENGITALEALGALEEATRAGERIRSWELLDERLRVLSKGTMDDGTRFWTVPRRDLHQALANAALRAGAEIVTSSSVTDATPAGEVRFANGERARADLVVGADGIRSAVRSAIGVDAAVTDLQYMSQRVLIPRRATDSAHEFPGYWNGSRRIAVAGCGRRFVYVFMFCRPDDRAAWAAPLDRELWTASFPHLRDVIERIPPNGDWRGIVEVVSRPWSAGRVALLGDSAHAMAPTLGQGACIAMESAVALATILERHADVEAALAEWEQAQRPVVDATQRYGRAYIRLLTHWPEPLLDLRSALVWALSRVAPVQRRLAGTPSGASAGGERP